MNNRSKNNNGERPLGRSLFQITLSFALLALAVMGVTTVYWLAILQPRLYLEADANAKLQAQSQAVLLAEVLQPRDQPTAMHEVTAVMDKILLITNPSTKQAFFIGLSLELDYQAVHTNKMGELDLHRGQSDCRNACFFTEVPLYSPLSDELLGIAQFQASGLFFQTLQRDIRRTLIIESLLILALLLIAWQWLFGLGRRLHNEVLERRRAEADAQEANRAKSQFLANMSHEIRTPINAIQGLLYLVQQEEVALQVRKQLKKMDHATHSLLTIINEILDFSKIEAGRLTLETIPFDLYAALDRVRSVVGFRAVEKGLTLDIHQDEESPRYLRGDPNRLGQVLLNLMGNAIKFTEHGEVRLDVELVKQDAAQVTLKFVVRDTGIGINSEDQRRLFQTFAQADASITRRFGGTGLGLAISQRLVRLMGSRIAIESEPGAGSCFYFTTVFDLAEPSEVENLSMPAPDDIKSIEALRGTRVLLVEDQPINQEVEGEILSQAGLKVWMANHGQEAVQRVSENPGAFDLVLMDLQMPVMDGYTATRRLRADPRLTGLPIIAMTANVLADERERCLEAGMNDYLTKPIDVTKLYALLRCWVQPAAASASEQLTPEVEPAEDCAASFAPPPKTMQQPMPPEAPRTILVVDDQVDNIEVLDSILSDDYRVLFATSGADALTVTQAQHPDLILLDIVMPEMNGYEVCTRLQQDPSTRDTPVIFVTARDQDEDEASGLQSGAVDYLTKPLNPTIVRLRVNVHLELKRYRDFLVNQSKTDGLTGIANRRRFDEYLESQWQYAIRTKISLSLIMLDVDHFKGYNDCYGHVAGDHCLKTVGQTLAEGLPRRTDLLARYGGEEFACILPTASHTGAMLIAERLRERVAAQRIEHRHSSVLPFVTISVGVASLRPDPHDNDVGVLIEMADRRLYRAKQTGRNRVVGEAQEA